MEVLNLNGLKVGVDVPAPDTFQWQLIDLSSDDSGEDMTGYTVKDIVRRKRHLSLAWGKLSFNDAHLIIAAVSDINAVDFDVKYPDLLAGTIITRTMHVGDRSSPLLVYNEKHMYVSGVSFNLVEAGGDQP